MRVSLLITGDEVLYGRVRDENAYYASSRVRETGNEMVCTLVVGDSPEEIAEGIRLLSRKSELIIVSGGLGATGDDLTRPALELLGYELVESELAKRRLERILKERGLDVNVRDSRAFLFPKGGEELRNPAGIALGIRVRYENSDLFFLPGVPDEFRATFDMHVLPVLRKGGRSAWLKKWTLFGIREVELEELLMRRVESLDVKVSFLPSYPLLNVEIRGENEADEEKVSLIMKEIAGAHLFIEGEKTPGEILKELFMEKKVTLSTAESCTGGLVASIITDTPGSSNYFLGGYVTYSVDEKVSVLGIERGLIERAGVVSEETAGAMAEGACRRTGSTWAVSTTGYAGPEGGDEKNPVGTVYVGVAREGKKVTVQRFLFHGGRLRLKRAFAMSALFVLYSTVKAYEK